MKHIILILTALVSLCSVVLASPVYATNHLPLDKICQETPEATACEDRDQTLDNNKLYGPNGILTKVIHILSLVVGIISIFVMIISGVSFMTSTGDSAKVTKARETLTYGAIGLIVVAFAQLIVVFVLNKLRG